MTTTRLTLLVLCVSSLHTSHTIADSVLPPIIVSAARSVQPGLDIPVATTIIDADDIANSGARDIDELLRRVTALHIADGIGDGGSSRIDMRGFGATAQSNVAVLVNGRKINPASDGATLYLNSIDLDNVSQIEIVEGSAGTLYGNQAVGGLINIVTRPIDGQQRRIDVAAGSFNAREITATLAQSVDDVGLRAQIEHRSSDNYRDRNASRVTRFDGRLELDHDRGKSYIDVQLLDDYVETPGALLTNELAADRRQAVFSDDYLDTRSKVLRIGTRLDAGRYWRFEGELALREDDRDFVQSFRGFPGSPSNQQRDSAEITPRLVGNFDGTVVTLGMDALRTDYHLVTAFGPQGNDQWIRAWYAQLTHPFDSKLSVTAGLRHARVDNDIDNNGAPVRLDDDVTVGSLGLSYRPTHAWRWFLRADQNYRFAKVDEHTNVPFAQPVGLDTQRGVSYETGVEYRRPGFGLNLRAYHLRLKDEISFDAATFSNVNLAKSRRRGVTVTADGTLSQTLSGGIGYRYVDSEITSGTHEGKHVPLVPEHRATAFVSYAHGNWRAQLDMEHVDEQFLGSDFDNDSAPLDAYTVANLVVHRDIGDWRISAKINNLFDENYSESGASSFAGDGFNPAAERNFWLGVSYEYED